MPPSNEDLLPLRDSGQVVLVVDDEPDILASFRDIMDAYLPEADVVTATSGPEALDLLRRRPVDLIVTDYKMPDMNGLAFLAEARRLTVSLPRIMITAFPDLELAVGALNEERITSFLTKPLQRETLVQTVGAALAERRATVVRQRAMARAVDRLRKHLERQSAGAPSG